MCNRCFALTVGGARPQPMLGLLHMTGNTALCKASTGSTMRCWPVGCSCEHAERVGQGESVPAPDLAGLRLFCRMPFVMECRLTWVCVCQA